MPRRRGRSLIRLSVTALLAVVGAPVLATLPASPAPADDCVSREGRTYGKGTECRNWIAGDAKPHRSVSMPRYEVITHADQMVPVRDGTLLNAQIYLPDAKGPFPCLVIIDGYGNPPDGSGRQINDFASRGYAVVEYDIRGIGGSHGDHHVYDRVMQEDGYDMIEWTARQKWCNGNVGTYGRSYLAITQTLVAKTLPPHLKAMIVVQGSGDSYSDVWYLGGMPPGTGRAVWNANPHAQAHLPPRSTPTDWQPQAERFFYEEALEHPTFDPWWRERSVIAEDYAAMARHGIKIMFLDSWHDYFVESIHHQWEQFTAAGGISKLFLGPWEHGGEHGADRVYPYEFQTYQVMWMDRWLLGKRNGIEREPPVSINVPGPDQWRFERDWPIPDARATPLYLRAEQSATSASVNDGTLSRRKPAAGEQSVTLSHSPLGPFNSASGAKAGGGAQQPSEDKRVYEARNLTWTLPPFTEPTEMTGPLWFTFYASSSAPDVDLVAELSHVAADGSTRQLTADWLRASHRSSHVRPSPLVPGKVYRFRMELVPYSKVFAPGDRIRLSLATSDAPNRIPSDQPATVTIYQDAAHASRVLFPLIGTAKVPG